LALFLVKSGGCLWVFRRYFGNQRQQVAIPDVREGRCLLLTLSSLAIN